MNERAQSFVNTLLTKTQEGMLSWMPGFEDGQFKTYVPGSPWAFVIQAQGDIRRFQIFDEKLDVLLDEEITKAELDAMLGPLAPTDPVPPEQNFYNSISLLHSQLSGNKGAEIEEKLAQAKAALDTIGSIPNSKSKK